MQNGSLKVIKDRRGVKVWRLQWRESGRGRTRILGHYADMSRAEADTERKKILAPLNARVEAATAVSAPLRRYVEDEYLTLKSRIWKDSTRGTTDHIIETHILRELGHRPLSLITRKELQAHLDTKAAAQLSQSCCWPHQMATRRDFQNGHGRRPHHRESNGRPCGAEL